MRKTWKQKMDGARPPHVEITDKAFAGVPAGVKMLVSSPNEVQNLILQIPEGRSMSIPELREALSKKHKADATCPLTASIFLRIVAENALEQMASGSKKDEVAPFWRAIGPKDPIAKKLSCGIEELARLRRAEGLS